MPNRWLLKTDPDTYSWADLVREQKTVWDGVTNALALKHLRAMREGDEAIVYETGGVKAAMGIARVASDPYLDPQRKDPKLAVVDLAAVRPLPRPVPLSEIKADPSLADFALVRLPRLSVIPVSGAQWQRILALAGDRGEGAPRRR